MIGFYVMQEAIHKRFYEHHVVVRSSGIEPEFDAWKASVLPLYHERLNKEGVFLFPDYWNRTSDKLITTNHYSQLLYQLS